MYKEIIIISIIIILIVVLNVVTQSYTKESVTNLSDTLYSMREDFFEEEKNQEKLKEYIDKTFQEWNNRHDRLAYYIEHDELEKVENNLTMLRSHIETEEYEEGVAQLDSCVFILQHIQDKEAFNLKNIF